MDKKRIQAYYIHRNLLPLATKLMNEDTDNFKSRVIDVIYQIHSDFRFNCEEVIVIVEIEGYYPYITGKWQEELKASHELWMGDKKRWQNQSNKDYREDGQE